MANASILAMKEQHVAEIKDRLTRAQSVVMFDYRGLTVDEVTALRVEMRKAGVEYIVLNNTMVERACRELNIDAPQPDMSEWTHLVDRIKNRRKEVHIGLVGKYVQLHDAYLSVAEALRHAG